MIQITNKAAPMLHKAPNRPYHTPDRLLTPTVPRSHRLPDPPYTYPELTPGDPIEGLGNFRVPTRQLGTVERTN